MRVTVHTEVQTAMPPDLVRAALLDFTDRRPALWSQLDPNLSEVHWVDGTSAEVTEGSQRPMVWSREHYDWSHPATAT